MRIGWVQSQRTPAATQVTELASAVAVLLKILIGNEFLKSPQIAIADAEFLQFRHGLIQVGGARADMSAGARKNLARLEIREAFTL